MATTNRGHPADIKATLLKQGHRFSFLQAVRLLRLLTQEANLESGARDRPDLSSGTRRRDMVRTRPELSFDFPGTDIVTIEETGEADENGVRKEARYLITATFLGLYGASSPLPAFYTEDLMDEAREDTSEARDFLDIINSSLYALRFECWSKFRTAVKVLEEEDPRFLERLFCLLGLGMESVRSQIDNVFGLIKYTGLFLQTPRSALGLETLLCDAMQEPRLKVIPCFPRTAKIPTDQLLRLGVANHRLGVNSYLGRKINDRMGKFRVRVGPLDWGTCQDWLPDTDRFKKLGQLIRLYLDQPLEWDLEVVLADDEARTTRIGTTEDARLGWDTWVFSGDTCNCEAMAYFQV